MQLFVINPPNAPFTESSLLIEPIDVLSVATFLQDQGHQVRFYDMDVKQLKPQSLESEFEAHSPDITIIVFDYHIPLFTNGCMDHVVDLVKIAKNQGGFVILGGKMSQHHSSRFFHAGCDVIIHHEMEFALQEILSRLEIGKTEFLQNILGISYRKDQKIHSTQSRGSQYPLDKIPIANRNLIDLNDYIDVRTILSSRGCHLKCTFCPTPGFWGNWRSRSASHVVDEIEQLTGRHHAKKILFLDDNAMVSPKRMREISHEIMNRGVKCKLGCLGTVSSYDKKTISLMKRAGFKWIHYGGESGSQNVLNLVNKKISVEQMKNAILGTKRAGMRVRTSWIFDLPGMDQTAVQQTMSLIMETEPDEIRVHYLSLRFGSELERQNHQTEAPQQYIHNCKANMSKPEQSFLENELLKFNTLLQDRGYNVVLNPSDWKNIAEFKTKTPDMKFVSYCPMRYGMDWENTK